MTERVVIDTDPGTDDALALLLALRSSALQVEAVTTVGGNAPLRRTTDNALRLLQAFERKDVRVAAGAARPLHGAFHYGQYYHGPSGLTVRLPRAPVATRATEASGLLVDLARAAPGQITVVALGPLTNVARAILQEPRFPSLVRRVVIMGGALECWGNVTRYAEFNAFNDPEAADLVLRCGAQTVLVPLDACRQTFFTRRDVPSLLRGDPAVRLMGRMLQGWFRLHPKRRRYQLCDPLAVAVAVDPALATTSRCAVRAETRSAPRRGQTVATWGEGTVDAVMAVDKARFWNLLSELLGAQLPAGSSPSTR